ncbi:MAG: hydrogenase small subunit [Dehalococcoidia bacterium]
MDAGRIDLAEVLAQRGVSRRRFLKYCATMAAALALPPRFAFEIARGLQSSPRIPVIWLEGQDCAGNSEALLRAEQPTISELILQTLSLDHHHLLMAPSGKRTEKSIEDILREFPNGYVAVIEGAIPLADGGVYCTIGGRAFAEVAREIVKGALATVAVGTCALDGGLPAARGGLTGAVGVSTWLNDPTIRLINLPGCPMNPDNLTALVIQYLALQKWPEVDSLNRPLFAYGDQVHATCESLPHYRAKEFVKAWGDEGHRKGWCLYEMGCKGPSTDANCSTLKFNGGTSWPVSSGHGCVGCTMPQFWDAMSPFYASGRPQVVPTPTPVDYRTPVPETRTPAPPGSTATPGSGPSSGDDDNGALLIGLGAVAVAAAGGAGAFIAVRSRRGHDAGQNADDASPDEGTEEER